MRLPSSLYPIHPSIRHHGCSTSYSCACIRQHIKCPGGSGAFLENFFPRKPPRTISAVGIASCPFADIHIVSTWVGSLTFENWLHFCVPLPKIQNIVPPFMIKTLWNTPYVKYVQMNIPNVFRDCQTAAGFSGNYFKKLFLKVRWCMLSAAQVQVLAMLKSNCGITTFLLFYEKSF